jgi:hypothetical protein
MNELRCLCGNIATHTYLDVLPICKSCKYLIIHNKHDEVTLEIVKSAALIRQAQSKMNIFDLI